MPMRTRAITKEGNRATRRLADKMTEVQREAYTVAEFCEAHRISRAMFYVLARDADGPQTMKVGRRKLVSREAAANWRRRMEARASGSVA